MSDTKNIKPKRSAPPENVPHALAAAVDAATSSKPTVTVTAAAPPVALPRPRLPPPRKAAEDLFTTYRGVAAALGDSQRAVAAGVSALALEMTGLARANLTAAGDSAAALAGARNLADAVQIQFGFARRSLEAMAASSARLIEIGARLASEASRPIVAPLTGSPRID